MSEAREQMEKAADRIRDELMVTLKELDRRRHSATDVRAQLRDRAPVLIGVGVGVVGISVGTAFLVARRRRRVARRLNTRWDALVRAWEHPARLATRAEERPFPVALGQKLAISFAVAFGTQIARRIARSMLPVTPREAQSAYAG